MKFVTKEEMRHQMPKMEAATIEQPATTHKKVQVISDLPEASS